MTTQIVKDNAVNTIIQHNHNINCKSSTVEQAMVSPQIIKGTSDSRHL